MDETKVVPAEESTTTETVETKTEEKEVKISDTLDAPVVETKEPKMVPEAVLIEVKKENKQMAKDLRDLKALVESGATKKEISSDLKEIADKHNVDADFVNEFAEAVRGKVEKEIDEKNKPMQEKQAAQEWDAKFSEAYDKAISENPEYKDLAKKDVIKALIKSNPENLNKPWAKILEESYGHLVTGRKTLETTKPRGGVEDTSVDLSRAARDPEYFKEVMADPELRKKYNDDLAKRNRF